MAARGAGAIAKGAADRDGFRPAAQQPPVDAFVKRLRELGYDEGQNLAFEYVKVPSADAYAEGRKEVVGRQVDIIIAQGPEEILKAAMAATNKLPIVMIAIDFDPFARGYVTNLAHPTGNVTGIALRQHSLRR